MSYRRLCAIALLLIGFCTQASAESWPTKPIRAIVPYSPGSATDIIPRTIFAQVQKQLGQPIIIENRPGGASTIGTATDHRGRSRKSKARWCRQKMQPETYSHPARI